MQPGAPRARVCSLGGRLNQQSWARPPTPIPPRISKQSPCRPLPRFCISSSGSGTLGMRELGRTAQTWAGPWLRLPALGTPVGASRPMWGVRWTLLPQGPWQGGRGHGAAQSAPAQSRPSRPVPVCPANQPCCSPEKRGHTRWRLALSTAPPPGAGGRGVAYNKVLRNHSGEEEGYLGLWQRRRSKSSLWPVSMWL